MRAAWRNWAGNVVVTPSAVSTVSGVDGVVAAVRAAGSRGVVLRPAGSGHSFTPLVATDGVVLLLDGLSGVVSVDREGMRVRVLAGTPLHELNPALQALGLALPNLGDIDRQTISGAVATGTHGTGTRLQGIAAAVCGLTLVLADGSLFSCSAEHEPEVFQAARVGLGALGVVVEVELQCVPAFRLRAREAGESFTGLLEVIQEEADSHDHLDVLWFPHTDRAMVKRNDRAAPDEGPGPLPRWRRWLDDDLLSNRVYEVVNRVGAARPSVVPTLNRVSAAAWSPREYVDDSWKVFCASRDVRFVESEYAVPRAAVTDVLRELRGWVDRSDESLPFPVEVRFTGADDVWLSTAHERDNAYVAVHQYHRMEHRAYFAAFEAIVAEHEGRPHWGKMHSLGADRLRELYPRFEDFLAVRDRLDPDRRFTNAHLRHVLGD
jgi:FAD-linked oxidoreductase